MGGILLIIAITIVLFAALGFSMKSDRNQHRNHKSRRP
jgi:hypothetical protein